MWGAWHIPVYRLRGLGIMREGAHLVRWSSHALRLAMVIHLLLTDGPERSDSKAAVALRLANEKSKR